MQELVPFLAAEDLAVLMHVAGAFEEIGPFAVGPLIAALPKASSPRHRLAIVGALFSFGQQAKAPATCVLSRVAQNDPDPHVRAATQAGRFPAYSCPTWPNQQRRLRALRARRRRCHRWRQEQRQEVSDRFGKREPDPDRTDGGVSNRKRPVRNYLPAEQLPRGRWAWSPGKAASEEPEYLRAGTRDKTFATVPSGLIALG